MLAYLNGLYLLDPFYQACREGLASGLYRLEEIAPDHFRQGEYYLSYFHDNVLEDEVQFILQVPGQGALSLSLGMQRMFADEECGDARLALELGPGADAAALAATQPAPVAGCTAGRDGHADTRRPQPLRRQRAIGTGTGDRPPDPSRLLVEGHGRALAISPETIKVHRRTCTPSWTFPRNRSCSRCSSSRSGTTRRTLGDHGLA